MAQLSIREERRRNIRTLRRLESLPREVRRELRSQAIEAGGEVILKKLKQTNFAFIDRSGDLRKSIRLGRPKNTRYGVGIPIIAGRQYRNKNTKAHYAGFVELGTVNFFPKHFIRSGMFLVGINAILAVQKELRRLLMRYNFTR